MKDFIHKSLLNAGSKDAVSNMLQGAALGAGANTALGAVQGDFDIVGNATSGALLGAGGGAAMRHMGDKYASAIANMRKQGIEGSDSFATTHFTHAIKEESDFMGNAEMLKRAQGLAPSTGSPASKSATASTSEAKAGQVSTKDGTVRRPGAEGHRDQPKEMTSIEVPTMPETGIWGIPKTGFGKANIPVVNNTESVGEAIGRAGRRKGGGFTPMSAGQVMAQESNGVGQAARNMANQSQSYADGWNSFAKDATISQQKAAGQSVRDARAANQNTGDSLIESSNSYKELLKESQEKKSAAQGLEKEIRAGGYVPDGSGGWKLPSNPSANTSRQASADSAQEHIAKVRAERAERQQGIGGNFDRIKQMASSKKSFLDDMKQGGYVKHSDGSWGFPENAPAPVATPVNQSKKRTKKGNKK